MPRRITPPPAGTRLQEIALARPGDPAVATRTSLDPREALTRDAGCAVFRRPGRGKSAKISAFMPRTTGRGSHSLVLGASATGEPLAPMNLPDPMPLGSLAFGPTGPRGSRGR